jgi:hypothetical protein
VIAAAVAKYLAAEVTGLTYASTSTGGNVYVQYMPAGPDIAVAVMSTGGNAEPSRLPFDSPNVQVLVRGERHAQRAAYDMAREVYDTLAALSLVTLDDGGTDEVFVIGATPAQSDPISLGPDTNDRPEWSLNVGLQVSAPTTHRPAYS